MADRPQMTRQKFTRRIYRRPAELLEDFRFIWERRPMIRRAMRGLISPAFRERLMMTVTEVNGCRYCSYYHARLSLLAGISQDELRELLPAPSRRTLRKTNCPPWLMPSIGRNRTPAPTHRRTADWWKSTARKKPKPLKSSCA
jgi:AhpD family alkylhydroperoxidase